MYFTPCGIPIVTRPFFAYHNYFAAIRGGEGGGGVVSILFRLYILNLHGYTKYHFIFENNTTSTKSYFKQI